MKKTRITTKELQSLSKEDLLAIVRETEKIKLAAKHQTLESYFNTAHPSQLEFHKAAAKYRIRYFSGGNRCVIDSTLVSTEGGDKAIADISQSDRIVSFGLESQKFQLSLGSIPYPKGKESLYRVVHEQGELVGSGGHLLLCSDGEYRPLVDISDGQDVLFLPKEEVSLYPQSTISGFGLKSFLLSDLSSTEKALSFLDHYGSCIRQYGQQLRLEAKFCLSEFQELSGVQEFYRPDDLSHIGHTDDLGQLLLKRNRLCRVFDSICNAYFYGPLEAHYAASFLTSNFSEFFEQTSGRLREYLLSLMMFADRLKEELFDQETALFLSSKTHLPFRPSKVKIHRIEKLHKTDWIWDLTVFGNHNYISNGLVSHNSGKSTAGFVEDIMIALGRHPYIKNRVPNKGVVVVQDFENAAKNVLEVKFIEWTPEGEIERVEKNQAQAWRKIFFKNGSTIDVLSHDQDMKVFEGSDYDWAHFDEPPPKHIYTAIWRSLTDRGGRMHMTATPLASPWLYQEYKKALDGDTLRWFKFVKTMENVRNLGDGDEELGKKRVDEFASLLDESEKAARLDGEMIQMNGLIFKQWDGKHHLIEEFPIPANWSIWESIDPHPNKPWAVVWIAETEGGHKILVRSAMLSGTIDEIADAILYEREKIKVTGKNRPRIVRCVIDNSSSVPTWQKSNTDPTLGRISVREELENIIGPNAGGPIIEVAPKNVQQKIDLFRRWLRIDEETGHSTFYVFDIEENDRFVFEIENYVWDSTRAKGLKNTPRKIDDDCLDAVMQVALSLPKDVEESTNEIVRIWENKSWTNR